MKTSDFDGATEIVAKHIETLDDSALNSMINSATRYAEIVERLLDQGAAVRPVPRIEQHLLADSLEQWVRGDVLPGKGPNDVVTELADNALKGVDWLALAEQFLATTVPPAVVSEAA